MISQPIETQPLNLQDYTFFVEQGGQLTSIQNSDNRLVYASPALENLLGYASGELIGKALDDLLAGRDFLAIKDALRTLRKGPFTPENALEFHRKDGEAQWMTVQFRLMPGTQATYAAFYQDQRRIRQIENILGALAFDPAIVPDERFFEGLLWNTARVLEVDFAFMTVTKAPYDSVRMLAFWQGDHFAKPYEYGLDNTPCDRVIRHGEETLIPLNVQGVFPKDQDLVALNAQSYLGVPIYDRAGLIKGHLALLDRQPLKMTPFRKSITTLFARQLSTMMEKL